MRFYNSFSSHPGLVFATVLVLGCLLALPASAGKTVPETKSPAKAKLDLKGSASGRAPASSPLNPLLLDTSVGTGSRSKSSGSSLSCDPEFDTRTPLGDRRCASTLLNF